MEIKTRYALEKRRLVMTKTIGALSIGQSPRSDLLQPFSELIANYGIIERGALDDVSQSDLLSAPKGSYPLQTRLRDGTPITVDEAFLTPLLQQAIKELEEQGVAATVLLCAGPFQTLHNRAPLFRPFQVTSAIMSSLNLCTVAVVCPVDNQHVPAREKWQNAGFSPITLTIDPGEPAETIGDLAAAKLQSHKRLEGIVLDYFCFTAEQLLSIQKRTHLPVFDMGQLTMMSMASVLGPC